MRAFACFPSSSERFSIINNRYTDRTQCFLHLIDAKWLVAHKLRSETSTNLTLYLTSGWSRSLSALLRDTWAQPADTPSQLAHAYTVFAHYWHLHFSTLH